MDADHPRFRLLPNQDHLELHLPQQTLDVIEAMLRELVPKLCRYAWFVDAEGWAHVFEGAPPSDRTYLMRCLGAAVCEAGEAVCGFRVHPTPNLPPFEIRLHVQTLGAGTSKAVLICQPHDDAEPADLERLLATIRPRLEELLAGGASPGSGG